MMTNTTQHIDPIERQIVQRLSLRPPQKKSLSLLVDVLRRIELSKEVSVSESLKVINDAYESVTDFERDFPSLCFALATGVGKTRLMGAFIAYLFLTDKSKSFMVLAPNTTIYEKLIADFTQGSPKYVFQGIAELAQKPPKIITGDNWDSGRGVRSAETLDSPIINIFNVDKINKDKGRIRKMQEYIGQSYFDYLAGLPDLVMLMDEAHRYRAKAGMNAIAELKPVLGLELTATPKAVGAKTNNFKNVIYHYPLSDAMKDGFVKKPAATTRKNSPHEQLDSEQLQRLKLKDGIHCHKKTRAELILYADENDCEVVKPFILVVAKDTKHSKELLGIIKSDDFFDGEYKDKVTEINSAQKGEESEEATRRLLELEYTQETEIVIHVNKLKEGWDVTNLYTIVPLRSSASEILTEQTIGRGLRLPYGKRTGNELVDKLTIVAHEQYDKIIDKSRQPDSIIQMGSVVIGDDGDVPDEPHGIVTVPPKFLTDLTGQNTTAQGLESSQYITKTKSKPILKTEQEKRVAKTTIETIQNQVEEKCKNGFEDLQNESMKSEIVQSVKDALPPDQVSNIEEIVDVVVENIVQHTIEIPEISIAPTGDVSFKFEDFDLTNLSSINYQPISNELMSTELGTEKELLISQTMGMDSEESPENYIVKHLMKMDAIDYDNQAELLYKLAGQAVKRIQSYLPNPDDQRNVCLFYGLDIANFILEQMMEHYSETPTKYVARVRRGFTSLKPQRYGSTEDAPRDFKNPVSPLSETQKYIFGGFKKCCFNLQKFDSDPERRLAVLLEKPAEESVIRWMKPAKKQFHIEYKNELKHNPDFIVETVENILIIEVKAEKDMNDEEVAAKAKAATEWTQYANEVAREKGKKEWCYLLVPHNKIRGNSTLQHLKSQYTYKQKPAVKTQ